MILFCTRYSGSNDDNDVESSVSRRSGRSGISRTPSMNGGGTQYASALQNGKDSHFEKKRVVKRHAMNM